MTGLIFLLPCVPGGDGGCRRHFCACFKFEFKEWKNRYKASQEAKPLRRTWRVGALQAAVVRASSQTALESAALRLFNMAADCTALCHICRQKGWPESKTASMQQEANHLPVR